MLIIVDHTVELKLSKVLSFLALKNGLNIATFNCGFNKATLFLRARASIAITRISYGNSVCLSHRLSVSLSGCLVPVPFQDQVS